MRWMTFIGLIFIGMSCQSEDHTPAPLNVILIMADDLGYETIGANGGNSYATPNIDAIAEGGIRFETVLFPTPLYAQSG